MPTILINSKIEHHREIFNSENKNVLVKTYSVIFIT